jgi:hypothetical protein
VSLPRRTRIARKRDKPRRKRPELFAHEQPRVKYAKRPRNTPRMRWTKTLRCCAHRLAEFVGPMVLAIIGPCSGAVEADHPGGGAHTGMQRKSDDATCIPLCERHHRSPGMQHLAYGKLRKGVVQDFRDQMGVEYDALWTAHLSTSRQPALEVTP